MTQDILNQIVLPCLANERKNVITEPDDKGGAHLTVVDSTEAEVMNYYIQWAFLVGQRGGNLRWLNELKESEWEVTDKGVKFI